MNSSLGQLASLWTIPSTASNPPLIVSAHNKRRQRAVK